MKSRRFLHAILDIKQFQNHLVAAIGNQLVFFETKQLAVVDRWCDPKCTLEWIHIDVCEGKIIAVDLECQVSLWDHGDLLWIVTVGNEKIPCTFIRQYDVIVYHSHHRMTYTLDPADGSITTKTMVPFVPMPYSTYILSNNTMVCMDDEEMHYYDQNHIRRWSCPKQMTFGPFDFSVSSIFLGVADLHNKIDLHALSTGHFVTTIVLENPHIYSFYLFKNQIITGEHELSSQPIWTEDVDWITNTNLQRRVILKLIV